MSEAYPKRHTWPDGSWAEYTWQGTRMVRARYSNGHVVECDAGGKPARARGPGRWECNVADPKCHHGETCEWQSECTHWRAGGAS